MRYIIFGSGGMAKELIGYLLDDGHEIECLVSTEPLDPSFKYPVFHKAPVAHGARYLLAVSDPATKRKLVSENEDKWDSFFHSSCYVSRHASVGRGSILAPRAILAGNPVVGNFVFLNTQSTIGHDAYVGHYSSLMPNAEVCGNCSIGDDALIGIGAYVLQGRSVGNGARVSAGAIVRHNVEEKETVYGDPARPKAA